MSNPISKETNKDTRQIIVSIVILTKNGGKLLQDSIKMIFSQKNSFDYEIVVVDSGSSDGTLEFLSKYPVKIFHIKADNFCFGSARDLGFSKALGRYIVTLSQDSVPANEYWLTEMVMPLIDDKADVVQGTWTPPNDRKIFFWEAKDLFYFTSEKNEFIKKYGGIGLSCTNLATKSEVWKEAKFGPAPMNEDKMFQRNAYSRGFRLIRNKKAIVYHCHNYSPAALVKRCENEGMGWKYLGVKYTFFQMLKDLRQKRWMYGLLLNGILRKEITNFAEALFLFIRPILLYKGNLINKKYKF
jgi:rhamnosyltransferase